MLRKINVGKHCIEVLLLQRPQDKNQLVKLYKKICEYSSEIFSAEQAPGRIGIQIFHRVVSLLTVPTRSKSCVSYYYTDGVVEKIPYLLQMLTRLSSISEKSAQFVIDDIASLKEAVRCAEDFFKYEIEDHLDASFNGSREGMHCSHFAFGEDCEHEHYFQCKKCGALDLIETHFIAIVDKLIPLCTEDIAEELMSKKKAAKRIQCLIFKFVSHLSRGKLQDTRLK